MTLVHSEKLKISDAVTRLRAKQLKTFLDMYKANLVSMSIFFGIRQQMFENQHVYPWKLSHDQTIMLTAVISSIAANLIYQPLETLQSRLVVDTKSSLRSVISSNISNLSGVKSLFRGFTTKTVSTSVFNCVYLPMYASLKGKFNSFWYSYYFFIHSILSTFATFSRLRLCIYFELALPCKLSARSWSSQIYLWLSSINLDSLLTSDKTQSPMSPWTVQVLSYIRTQYLPHLSCRQLHEGTWSEDPERYTICWKDRINELQ